MPSRRWNALNGKNRRFKRNVYSVEVRLEMLRPDAMVTAIEPSLQVAQDEVNERQVLLRNVRIAALRDLREPAALSVA